MTVFLEKEGVLVDSSKIVIHGTSYPLRNISAYRAQVVGGEVFDWMPAMKIAAVVAAIIAVVAFFFAGDFYGLGEALLFFVMLFPAVLVVMNLWIKQPSKWQFDHSYLSLTSAGTTKHALIIRDEKNDLVFDVQKALDEAIADHR